MREKTMNRLTLTVREQELGECIDRMQSAAMEYVSAYYPDADIEIDVEIQSSSILSIGDSITLSILIYYYDAEIQDGHGGKMFNNSTLLYTSMWGTDKTETDELTFRFLYGEINDPVSFLPIKSIGNSFESRLMNYLYQECFEIT